MEIPQYTVLAIESSCDDTGVAVLRGNEVLSNLVANQKVHSRFGGVVPELASRAHQSNIIPTVTLAIEDAGINPNNIDAVAYTNGPGLNGSLLVGASFAKSWAWANGIPTIPIHHMRAHILAHFIHDTESPSFPFLCLTVSGGHTQIVRVDSPSEMEVIGSTLDDAAGEAFDKGARILGLGYPGGPEIEKYAKGGNPKKIHFPRSLLTKDSLEFSFSGLKTSLLYFMDEFKENSKINKHDVVASYQQAIIETLVEKVKRALNQTRTQTCVIAGGVAANKSLRKSLSSSLSGKKIIYPDLSFCTDNAAMISYLGEIKFRKNKQYPLDFSATPNQKLD